MEWFAAHSSGILRGSMVNTDDTTQLIWIKYMAMANEAKDPDSGRLEFAKGQPYPIDYIAMVCRKPVKAVLKAEAQFKADLNKDGITPRVLIEPDGTRVLSNWATYQRRKDGKRISEPIGIIPKPDKMPLTVEETIQRQKQLAADMAYKFPDDAQVGRERKLSERKHKEKPTRS